MIVFAFGLGLLLGSSAAVVVCIDLFAAGPEVIVVDCPSNEEEVLP